MFENKIDDLIHLFEDGAFSRRELFDRLKRHTGSAAAATAAIAAAGLADAQTPAAGCLAQVQVPENAPDIRAEDLSIYSDAGPLLIYQAQPREFAGPRPGVLVIHENRGLNEHIRDVTRRVARAGYIAVGLDLLSRQGGTRQFADPEAQGAAYNRTRPEERRADMINTLLFMREQTYIRGDRLGAIGFCAGGGNVFDLAVNTDTLAAAVTFYGTPVPPAADIARIGAPLLAIFAELDRGVTGRVPELVTALLGNSKSFALHVYQGANHAFNNDTGARYDPAAACDAWARTLDFFRRHLYSTGSNSQS